MKPGQPTTNPDAAVLAETEPETDYLAEIAGVKATAEPDPVVQSMLDLTQSGSPRGSLLNSFGVLAADQRYANRLSHNDFTKVDLLDGRPITDHDVTSIEMEIDALYGLRPSGSSMERALHSACLQHSFHPVRDYLDGLQWDGRSRLDYFLASRLGAEATDLNAELGRRWFIAAVARIMDPGCKVDTAMVLVGRQGVRKSSACEALVPDPAWFSDTMLAVGSKDAYLNIQGIWLYEIAEMHSIEASGRAKDKAFLSSRKDRYRPPYGRRVQEYPRQVVFIGTTNEQVFLSDATGSRRYWPVLVTKVDLEGIRSDRDQLWAEAVHRYQEERCWWLTPEWEHRLAEASLAFTAAETWDDRVLQFASCQNDGFTVAQVLEQGLGMAPKEMDHSARTRVGLILSKAGYQKSRPRGAGDSRPLVWKRG